MRPSPPFRLPPLQVALAVFALSSSWSWQVAHAQSTDNSTNCELWKFWETDLSDCNTYKERFFFCFWIGIWAKFSAILANLAQKLLPRVCEKCEKSQTDSEVSKDFCCQILLGRTKMEKCCKCSTKGTLKCIHIMLEIVVYLAGMIGYWYGYFLDHKLATYILLGLCGSMWPVILGCEVCAKVLYCKELWPYQHEKSKTEKEVYIKKLQKAWMDPATSFYTDQTIHVGKAAYATLAQLVLMAHYCRHLLQGPTNFIRGEVEFELVNYLYFFSALVLHYQMIQEAGGILFFSKFNNLVKRTATLWMMQSEETGCNDVVSWGKLGKVISFEAKNDDKTFSFDDGIDEDKVWKKLLHHGKAQKWKWRVLMGVFMNGSCKAFVLYTFPTILSQSEHSLEFVMNLLAITYILAIDDIDGADQKRFKFKIEDTDTTITLGSPLT